MKVIHSASELRSLLGAHRKAGEKIGFVPTMGALHEGHATLLKASRAEANITVLSIFVNPTQFGPNEDFARYPRTLEADSEIARKAGVDYVFAPEVKEMYPEGSSTFIEVEGVSAPWCGQFRPGHFRGVATIVQRLFTMVEPHVAYFGQKDLQQCLVIQRMVKDLRLPVEISIVPTVREEDGLAMSSRNRYLSAEERKKALVISKALRAVEREFQAGNRVVAALEASAMKVLSSEPAFTVQYCEIRSLPNLEKVDRLSESGALAIAGFLGKTRLIDNVVLGEG